MDCIQASCGASLADALAQMSIFGDLYVSMVRAGETGGALEQVLERLADYLENQVGPCWLAVMRAIKAALDPQGLLNPGKAIPTLQRCAEFGAMHVHHGELKFPELERF